MRSVIDTLRKETEWNLYNAKLKPQKSEKELKIKTGEGDSHREGLSARKRRRNL